jgi:hypothetical protein
MQKELNLRNAMELAENKHVSGDALGADGRVERPARGRQRTRSRAPCHGAHARWYRGSYDDLLQQIYTKVVRLSSDTISYSLG